MKFNATKIPKKKDAKKLTIEVFLISIPNVILKLLIMIILSINPKVLPSKTMHIELKSKA